MTRLYVGVEWKEKTRKTITTLKRTNTKEITAVDQKMQDVQKLAEDRYAWKTMISALCAKLDTRGK
jgi:hypothetical protein